MFRSPLGVTAWLRAPPLEGFEPAHTTPEAAWDLANAAGHGLARGRSGGASPRIGHGRLSTALGVRFRHGVARVCLARPRRRWLSIVAVVPGR